MLLYNHGMSSTAAPTQDQAQTTTDSAGWFERAQRVTPGGVNSPVRAMRSVGRAHPPFIARGAGSRITDVEGTTYVDWVLSWGALPLGHADAEIVAAIRDAAADGSSFGAPTTREVELAELVCEAVPCAEQVRFTSSGTEATLMALRLARAFTGKRFLVRFMTHFHGWHDHMTAGHSSHFDGTPTAGVVQGIAENTILLPPSDIQALRAAFQGRSDIAAAILEPTGASFGMVPHTGEFVAALREETQKAGAVLIFDEVVTGFRVSPGGAQQFYGVTPDLTTLAKILAGGMPGGAVAGRRAILEELDFKATAARQREKIAHPGTYNANPVSAAAGIAALSIIAGSDVCARANAYGEKLRAALNEELARAGAPWAVYGGFSGFHLFLNAKGRRIDPRRFDPLAVDYRELTANPKALAQRFRLALLVNGIDFNGKLSGVVSAAHGEADLARTVEGFRAALALMKAEEELPASAA